MAVGICNAYHATLIALHMDVKVKLRMTDYTHWRCDHATGRVRVVATQDHLYQPCLPAARFKKSVMQFCSQPSHIFSSTKLPISAQGGVAADMIPILGHTAAFYLARDVHPAAPLVIWPWRVLLPQRSPPNHGRLTSLSVPPDLTAKFATIRR